MANIDKAREVAKVIKNMPDAIISEENYKALADGFLALDEQEKWHYPDKGEMPENDDNLEIIRSEGDRVIGFYKGSDQWLVAEALLIIVTDSVDCWRPLID